MADVKVTQRDMFNEIIALAESADREDIVEFAKGRIAQLDKKSSNRKNSKKSEENEGYIALVADVLAGGERLTVSEIMKRDATLGTLSNQKISALLRMMIADGGYAKDKDKKSTVFFKVVAEQSAPLGEN